MSECPTCGNSFKSRNGMKVHHAKTHGESIAGITITCDYCGDTAEKNQRKKRNDHDFCSRDCFNKWQSENLSGENSHLWEGKTITVDCDWCGESTEKKTCNYEENEKAFCSHECHGEWISENQTGEDNPLFDPSLTVECYWCGKEHQKAAEKIERNERNFCSMECTSKWQSDYRRGENHPRWKEYETVECSWCGESLERSPSVAERYDNFYCSDECHAEWVSHNNRGKDHPNWKGGHSNGYGANWSEQREKRLEKDGYECVVCGMSNGEHREQHDAGLHVHHIQRKESFRHDDGTLDYERANRLENLVTLCFKCHGRWEGIPLRPQPQ